MAPFRFQHFGFSVNVWCSTHMSSCSSRRVAQAVELLAHLLFPHPFSTFLSCARFVARCPDKTAYDSDSDWETSFHFKRKRSWGHCGPPAGEVDRQRLIVDVAHVAVRTPARTRETLSFLGECIKARQAAESARKRLRTRQEFAALRRQWQLWVVYRIPMRGLKRPWPVLVTP